MNFLKLQSIPYLCAHKNEYMLIIDVKESENLDKALKKYKKKFEKAGTVKELRRRQAYTKPSVERRSEILRAIYRLQMQNGAQE